ncbi:hypothetical protein RIF29_30358 [Crotalaria pallida]|uniref:RING-type E3 ubiquitin transferase n=1 Tax=Crotalaria pallida TaxID=3830 RepID=A0AAN9EL87_CROPI
MSGDIFQLRFWDSYRPGSGPGSKIQKRSGDYFEYTLINPRAFLQQYCPYILANYTPFRYHPRAVIDEVIAAMQQLYHFDDQGPPPSSPANDNANARPPRKFCVTLFILDAPNQEAVVVQNNYSILVTRLLPLREDIIKYYLEKKNNSTVLELDCPICLQGFHHNNKSIDNGGDDDDDDNDSEAYATRCNHVFHQQCILPWFQNNRSCPLCRHRMPLLTRQFLIRWF